VYLETRGYHRLGIFIKGEKPSSVVVDTFVQILDYNASDVKTTIWSCPSKSECMAQLVDIVKGPREYDVKATAARGYGMYVATALLPVQITNRLIELAHDCRFDHALDTIDKAPSVQVDLWHPYAGVPRPHLASLLLTSEVFREVMPRILSTLNAMHSWGERNVACTDAFVRRYKPGERLGVQAHRDTSDITVNCLLSSSETGFSGGFVYRFVHPYEVDVVPTLQGDCVFHAGQVKHGALPTEAGTRFTLITFWKVKELVKGSTSYEVGTKNPGSTREEEEED
jgi:hypothetical protein